jgi:drug/metabolite transporter (DMT)-like permease
VTSLLSGLLFVFVGVVFLFGDPGSLADQTRYLWPLVLIVLGLALLLSNRTRSRLGSSGAGEHRSGDEVGSEGGEDR